MQIKVSVIMPVYNSGIYLQKAISSILKQSLQEIELILVDDGSTDGSGAICDQFAKSDSRVIVLHQNNGGICNARNVALRIARGEYIGFSDHDDEYLPGLLKESYDYAVKEHSDILKFCKQEVVINNGVVLRKHRTVLVDETLSRSQFIKRYFELLNGKVLECVWDGLYRRDFLEKNNIKFDEFYKSGGEDIDFILKIMQKAERFSTIHNLFYLHYARIGISTSTKLNQNKLASSQKLAKTVHLSFSFLNIDISKYKVEYVFQMMFTLIDSQVDMLASTNSIIDDVETSDKFEAIRNTEYLPSWFYKISSIKVFYYSPKIGLSYFLFKHRFYRLMILMFKARKKQMDMKVVGTK